MVTRLWSDKGFVQMIDIRRRYSLAAHSKTSFSSCITLSSAPGNLYCFPSSRLGSLAVSFDIIPELSLTCTPHITSSIVVLTMFMIRLSLHWDAAKILRSSVTLKLMGLDNVGAFHLVKISGSAVNGTRFVVENSQKKVENLKRCACFPGWNFWTEFRVPFTCHT